MRCACLSGGETRRSEVPDYHHILSLDGGGIRGLLVSRLLERLEARRPGFLGSVDLLAGTSTGAIIALCLAAGITPEELSDLYRAQGRAIFEETTWDELGDVDRLVRADYDNAHLKSALDGVFGDMRMGDLPRKVLVATFDLDAVATSGLRAWKPKFVHNFEEESDDREQLVADVAMRSAAAPTFFPVYQGFVDGGVVANNPSMCALAQVLHPDTGGQHASRVALLSLGTGQNPHYLDAVDSNWGYVQWAPHFLKIMFEGASGIADYQCRQVLGKRYLRIDPVLAESIGLDAVDRIPMLEQIADGVDLDEPVAWLERWFGTPA